MILHGIFVAFIVFGIYLYLAVKVFRLRQSRVIYGDLLNELMIVAFVALFFLPAIIVYTSIMSLVIMILNMNHSDFDRRL